MFATQFISNEIFPLKKSDSTESALLFMADWMVHELPVVEAGMVLGVVRESTLLENDNKRVDQCMEVNTDSYVMNEHAHVFELWERLTQYGYNTLTLVNSEKQFAGIVSAKDIAAYAFANSALAQEGSVLVLEVQTIQYSLAELSRICESNDAKIIHLMIETPKGENHVLQVSIKLNKLYLAYVISSLERFGYKVVYSNSPLDPNQSLGDRYNWLLKYLNT